MSAQLCHWVEQCSPDCQERAEHADVLWPWIHDAVEKNDDLRRSAQVDQFDMFAEPPADEQMLELWEGIHRALGEEYRRRARLFWRECPQAVARAESRA